MGEWIPFAPVTSAAVGTQITGCAQEPREGRPAPGELLERPLAPSLHRVLAREEVAQDVRDFATTGNVEMDVVIKRCPILGKL